MMISGINLCIIIDSLQCINVDFVIIPYDTNILSISHIISNINE